ncbi:MAG: Peptide chain release factor subunit 1 [Candidatus Bathyarchaeota archaeon BA1]|nr:MAG: Peptide chain release factor subunit 1 [Candidatus Bathyarchaeota archaeon BA1]
MCRDGGMSTTKRTSLERFRLKKALETLARKEGRGTELVSLYIPLGRQVSEVIAMLRQEYGTASNIKSDTTRRNVQDAIVKVMQRLKLFKEVPENGLVLFCGAIPQDGPGSERIEMYVITPPEPIHIYLYRCDARFHIEHLQDLLKERETYGIMVIDSSATTFALLQGRRLEIIEEITSGVPGKHRAGGQSARRFERLREAHLLSYYKRIGEHANDIFLPIENLKGIMIGGPGPTKYDFEKGDHLHYQLKDRIIATIDTAYVSEQGVEEVVERAPEVLRRVRYVEEKRIIQEFLYEIGHDTGLATYGESEVKRALEMGAVKTLLLSEGLDVARVTVKCDACDYTKHETMKSQALLRYEQSLSGKPCPKCTAPALCIAEVKELIEDLAELAEHVGASVEIISTETEEGQMLKNSFGGIAATLRFKPPG